MKISKELKKTIILDHYKNPRNKSKVDDSSYLSHHENSESCIDDIVLQAKIEDSIIADIRFDGIACSISTAATSIMSQMFVGKTIDEAEYFIEQYNNMMFEKEYDENLMGDLIVFDELYMQANRIKCGLIGMNAMQNVITQYKHLTNI